MALSAVAGELIAAGGTSSLNTIENVIGGRQKLRADRAMRRKQVQDRVDDMRMAGINPILAAGEPANPIQAMVPQSTFEKPDISSAYRADIEEKTAKKHRDVLQQTVPNMKQEQQLTYVKTLVDNLEGAARINLTNAQAEAQRTQSLVNLSTIPKIAEEIKNFLIERELTTAKTKHAEEEAFKLRAENLPLGGEKGGKPSEIKSYIQWILDKLTPVAPTPLINLKGR